MKFDRATLEAIPTPIKSVEFANPSNVVRLPVRLRPVPKQGDAA